MTTHVSQHLLQKYGDWRLVRATEDRADFIRPDLDERCVFWLYEEHPPYNDNFGIELSYEKEQLPEGVNFSDCIISLRYNSSRYVPFWDYVASHADEGKEEVNFNATPLKLGWVAWLVDYEEDSPALFTGDTLYKFYQLICENGAGVAEIFYPSSILKEINVAEQK